MLAFCTAASHAMDSSTVLLFINQSHIGMWCTHDCRLVMATFRICGTTDASVHCDGDRLGSWANGAQFPFASSSAACNACVTLTWRDSK